MTDAVVAGLVAGFAIAIPVGAVSVYLLTLAATTSLRVGVAAGCGVAAVDGLYASVAVVGGAAVSGAIQAVESHLRWAAVVVLLVVAARMAAPALRTRAAAIPHRPDDADARQPVTPARAFLTLAGMTVVNPTTVVYFAALVIGGGVISSRPADAVVFVAAALLASASWQLVMAVGGSVLGRLITGDRGRRTTALIGAIVVAVLAARLMLASP